MNLLVNKSAKNFLTLIISVLLLGFMLAQLISYVSAVRFKNEMIQHDYELAGHLSQKYPEMASQIPALFTAVKTRPDLDKGRKLLERAGYINSVQIHLIPRANAFYKSNMAINFIFSFFMGAAILLPIYLFLGAHYKKIDRYNDDISRIMKGQIDTRLEDTEEGSLSRLAASINNMTSALHAHIEKEKHDRTFLKDILENVSHQLKTPLSALMMYNEIMKDENVENETIISFLNKSEKELFRMQTLIASLLKMAKLDAGIIELNKGNHILNDIIKQAAESFETRLAREGKTFELKAGVKVYYPCDREWMLEALSNLIKNAVEHTSSEGHISALLEETPLMVKITVRDNGEGIHPDDLNHIFKRFYRSRFSQNTQGAGIGLALAKTIVEMHGGFISVESELQKGSAFTVHLPRLTKQ